MADQVKNNGEGGGQVDFQHHVRDYSRLMKILRYGAIAAIILTFLVMIIIAS